jgi:hypothetical protein
MSGKGNFKFLCMAVVVVVLLLGLGWFVYSNDKKVDDLKQRYAQNDVPGQSVLSPRNVNAAGAAGLVSEKPVEHVVNKLNITFRAVGLDKVSSEADQELAFNVLSEMRSSPYFDATSTYGVGEISREVPLTEPPVKSEGLETPGTFSFKIVTKLKRPLTL